MTDWKSALAALGATKAEEPKEQKPAVERRKRTGVVYSTAPGYEYSDGQDDAPDTLPQQQQQLRLSVERAGRGGKTVTLVKGFVGQAKDLDALCRLLKQKCGVGGTAKDGDIVIQGDHRQRLAEILKKEGYIHTR